MNRLRTGDRSCRQCPRHPHEAGTVFGDQCADHWATGPAPVAFVFQDPGAGKGGPGTTGRVCCYHNDDPTARYHRALMDEHCLSPLSRHIYLTNAVLHGLDGKAPNAAAVRACAIHLRTQLDIQPRLVVTFGNIAADTLSHAYAVAPLPVGRFVPVGPCRAFRSWNLSSRARAQYEGQINEHWGRFAPEIRALITGGL